MPFTREIIHSYVVKIEKGRMDVLLTAAAWMVFCVSLVVLRSTVKFSNFWGIRVYIYTVCRAKQVT